MVGPQRGFTILEAVSCLDGKSQSDEDGQSQRARCNINKADLSVIL